MEHTDHCQGPALMESCLGVLLLGGGGSGGLNAISSARIKCYNDPVLSCTSSTIILSFPQDLEKLPHQEVRFAICQAQTCSEVFYQEAM